MLVNESMTFGTRLRALMAEADISQVELARKMGGGLTSQAVGMWCADKIQPRQPKLKKLAEILNTTVPYLLGLEAGHVAPDSRMAGPLREVTAAGSVRIMELDVTPQAGAGAPDISKASGHTILAEWEMPGDYVRSNTRNVADIRIVRVGGDSMEPEYPAGDRVLVDTSHRVPSPPGVYVLWDGFSLVLKRLEVIQGGDAPVVRISSANPCYPPYEKPAAALSINGKVVGKWNWK